MLKRILAFLRSEPAGFWVAALGTLAGIAVAVFKLDGTQAGYLTSIVTGLGSVLTAVLARPAHLAVIGGAAGSVLQALVLFNLHLAPTTIAAVVAGVNLVLGYVVLRPQLTPVVNAKPAPSKM
jgi:hypothetical protein